MLPRHLIEEFWDAVRGELRGRHTYPEPRATAAVAGYRAELDRRHFDDLIYHREPAAVAEAVVGWMNADQNQEIDVPA